MLSRRIGRSIQRIEMLYSRKLSSDANNTAKISRINRVQTSKHTGRVAAKGKDTGMTPITKVVLGVCVFGGVSILLGQEINKNREGQLGKLFWGSPVEGGTFLAKPARTPKIHTNHKLRASLQRIIL